MDDSLLDLLVRRDGRVVFVPVRHHSPTCARVVGELIDEVRPDAVLIEGPSDFNDRLDELLLDHRLPIAIYSYLRLPAGARRGAYYPFCDYSPEWQALKAGRRVGAAVRFIDLPWRDVALLDETSHRYADAELRRGRYLRHLCERLGVDDFDELWDRIVESVESLSIEGYLERAHGYCFHVRAWEAHVSESDRRREAFMASQLEAALKEHPGRIVVVTGGFHSPALCARLHGLECVGLGESPPTDAASAPPINSAGQPPDPAGGLDTPLEAGIALTPYSYPRLDSLKGYNAGMPSPGFYDHVWRSRRDGVSFSHRRILEGVVTRLREHGQTASTADLIAVETTARVLASLRGRATVWRNDLLDGVKGALVKEELEQGCGSPFLEAVLDVFRGDRRGQLADGARLPPLVEDIKRLLDEHGLFADYSPRDVALDLQVSTDLAKSRVLHGLRLIGVAGYVRTDGVDFSSRENRVRLWETWRVRWSPEFDATCIEAARYGTTLREASAARLAERAAANERNAEEAALILLDAAQAGVDLSAELLAERLATLVRQDGDFLRVASALDHLLYLYCYDEILGTEGTVPIGDLLRESFTRAAWLFEMLGHTTGQDRALLRSIGVLMETFDRARERLGLDRDELVGVLSRVERDRNQSPVVRGAAVGGLWRLDAADADRVRTDMLFFSEPDQLGDFLTGLFSLAREAAQRNPELVRAIDGMLLAFTSDEFLTALPSLRLAFTYFTPREIHHMLTTLFQSLGMHRGGALAPLEVDAQIAAAALAFEGRVFEAVARYGLRGGTNE